MINEKRLVEALIALSLLAVPVSAATPAPAKLTTLADCAGAVAVYGHVDPRGGGNDARSPWFMTYGYILSDMMDVTDPGKAYSAAVERWAFWSKQPAAGVAEKARTCKSQYP